MGHHELAIAGTRKTLDEWGVTACSVTTGALMGDVLSFTIPATPGTDDPVLSTGAAVALYDPAGVCRFIGRAMTPRPVVGAGAERYEYTVRGGDWLLSRVPYRQHWRFPDEVDDYVGPGTEMNEALVSLVTLFRDYATGDKVDLYEQLDHALDQAVDAASGEGVLLGYDLDYVPRDTSPFTEAANVEPPEDEKRDLTVLDVVEACLRWVPYVTARWDYSAGWPVLRFSSAPAVDPGSGVVIPGGTVYGVGFTTRTAAITELIGCEVKPLDDRLVKQLTISYLIETEATVGDKTIIYRERVQDVSTVANGAFGEMEITIPLRGAVWDGESYTAPEPRPPDGLARALHQAFARVWWEFALQRVGSEVEWAYQIGEGWSVTGIGSGPDGANAVAQQIVRDILSGTTRIQCGAPSHLGYGDLVALLMPNRLRTVPQRAGEQQYGFGEKEKKNKETDLSQTVEGWIDIGGTPQYKAITVKPATPP